MIENVVSQPAFRQHEPEKMVLAKTVVEALGSSMC